MHTRYVVKFKPDTLPRQYGGGGVTQDVGSGTIGVNKCGKWDYRGEQMWEVGL